MRLTVALLGQPNVGKSTLFNALTGERDALVFDQPGVTRDRQYGIAKVGEHEITLIDTGGLADPDDAMSVAVSKQAWEAASEADMIWFMVDGRGSVGSFDLDLAIKLRRLHKPVYCLVNKTDGTDEEMTRQEFYELGLGEPIAIAAAQKRGLHKLDAVIDWRLKPEFNLDNHSPVDFDSDAIRIAFLGRPNVGKSTLTNRMLGEERVVAMDQPGTTRDSIMIPLTRREKEYVLIDTAGIRRKSRVKLALEKFSVIKALQAIDLAQVCVVLIDANEGVTDQDCHLLQYVVEAGRCLILAVNKWDGLDEYQKEQVKRTIDQRLDFVRDFTDIHFISALHGTNVGHLFEAAERCHKAAMQDLQTAKLTKTLEKALLKHNPPLVNGRRIKLKYAHAGGKNPPTIVIHGNMIDKVPATYKRYLIREFRNTYKLYGTPIKILFRSGDNPYA